MTELNYQRNQPVHHLHRRCSHTIGLITPDNANPFFAQMARGIEEASFQRGFSVLLGNANEDLARELVHLQVMVEKQVDGIVLAASGLSSEHLCPETTGGLPLVLVDRDLPTVAADRILADHRRGGQLATEYLFQLGHRRIACIAGPGGVVTSAQRLAGYIDALAAVDIPVDADLIVPGTFDFESGMAAAQQLLHLPQPPTAIFACNDLMAIGAISAARQAGLMVPDDISVLGFDDALLATYSNPSLTTIHQPAYTLGKLAAEMLLGRIAAPDQEYRHEVLPVELIVRSSCRAPSTVLL
jgi:LacI family transcriptional regulator